MMIEVSCGCQENKKKLCDLAVLNIQISPTGCVGLMLCSATVAAASWSYLRGHYEGTLMLP